MGRPKADDPRVVVTLRLPQSVTSLIEADAGWRGKLEALICAHYAPRSVAPGARRFVGVTALGEEIEKPAFVSRLKKP